MPMMNTVGTHTRYYETHGLDMLEPEAGPDDRTQPPKGLNPALPPSDPTCDSCTWEARLRPTTMPGRIVMSSMPRPSSESTKSRAALSARVLDLREANGGGVGSSLGAPYVVGGYV
jgi:hypothetical protein